MRRARDTLHTTKIRRNLSMFVLLCGLLSAFLLFRSASADASCTLHATTSNLASVFSSAGTNAVICLANGSYNFTGSLKTGNVILQPEAGAIPVMNVNFDPATNITLDGVKISSMDLADSRTKNITVRNATVTGQVTFRTGELQNSNITFDHNVYRDFNATGSGGEGRLWFPEQTSQPSGITIENSEFTGGMSDGIQNGSYGTVIKNNDFHDLVEGSADGVHTDAIQLYGSKGTVITGNYFHDVPDAIMAPDGTDHETIENNVFKGAGDKFGYPFAITLYSDNSSIINHNTMADGSCSFNLRCGILRVGNKDSCSFASECDQSKGTIITNNILSEISCCDAGANTGYTSSYNLIRSGSGGSNGITGTPTYTSGTSPPALAGYALTAGSLGHNAASDHTDIGANVSGSVPTNPPSGPPSTDIATFLSHWHSTNSPTQDLDGSGIVDIFDLSLFLSSFGA